MPPAWRETHNVLATDLYELTMLAAYFSEGMEGEAVFSLFVRNLPPTRNFLLACGLDDVLTHLETLSFAPDDLEALATLGFAPPFLERLAKLRFSGSVRAVPEGTPVFAGEPLLEVTAPLPEAQLVETCVLNEAHVQTLLASKVARIVLAAAGRQVVDFGLRRTQGLSAGMKLVRAGYIAGLDATSNVLGGLTYGVPVLGTMAHSYVQAHDDEGEAFAAFLRQFPSATLLVDTYETRAAVGKIVALRRQLGPGFRAHAIRLDSGDLAALAKDARARLDEVGLAHVRIAASGGLDEHIIARLVEAAAPIDSFGVGASMSVSADAPVLDMAYKLVAYAGRDRVKRSPGKTTLPGAKQIYRVFEHGEASHDVLARHDEHQPGVPLLEFVMRGGRRVGRAPALRATREHCRNQLACLPARLRALAPAEPTYPIVVSPSLRGLAPPATPSRRDPPEPRTVR